MIVSDCFSRQIQTLTDCRTSPRATTVSRHIYGDLSTIYRICEHLTSLSTEHGSGNGPMWHYANTLYAEALGQAARIRADLRPKWVEFFRAWSESHWAYGDRTVPRAAEHFRPEDGTRCGSAWDYFHSAWIDPFILYWCGVSLSDGFEKLRFDPYTNEDFRLSGVPFVGRCYTFSQKTDESGRRVRTIFDADGRVLAVGEGALEVMLP